MENKNKLLFIGIPSSLLVVLASFLIGNKIEKDKEIKASISESISIEQSISIEESISNSIEESISIELENQRLYEEYVYYCESFVNNTGYYTSNTLQPKNIYGELLTENNNYAYSYKKANEDNGLYKKGLPTEIGKYTFKISYKDFSYEIDYEILPFKLKPTIDIKYQEGLTYNEVINNIKNNQYNISYLYENNNYIDNNDLPITLLNNIEIEYEDSFTDNNVTYNEENIDELIGSTYKLNIKIPQSDLYELYDANTNTYNNEVNGYEIGSIFIKYQTVTINDNYYTIEDALKEIDDISLIGNVNKTVITSFSNLDCFNKEYELHYGSTLYVNYKKENIDVDNDIKEDYVYSLLYIPSDITLNVNGILNVCASLTENDCKCYARGVLFNNGKINVNGKYNSYGYTLGDGLIESFTNGEISDVMRFYNYAGGGITLSLSNGKIFPLTCYSIHNISCKSKINYDSKFNVFYNIDLSGYKLKGTITLVGENGLFDLSKGYVIKDVKDTTSSYYIDKANINNYNYTNQDISQKDVIEIYGDFSDNVISIMQNGVGIKTGLDYAMPIGFMDIIIKENSVGTLSSNSYKFLPGSSLTIDKNATIIVSEDVNVTFYDELYDDSFDYSGSDKISYVKLHEEFFNSDIENKGAILINNGNLIVNGYIGGKITTTSENSTLTITNNYSTVLELVSFTYTGTFKEKLNILAGKTTATTTSNTYYLTSNNEVLENGSYVSDENNIFIKK